MGASLTITADKGKTLVEVPEDLEVSMTDSNTKVVLAALGFEFDDEERVSDMLNIREVWVSCVLYEKSEIAELVDTGTPIVEDGNHIHCGRREGYVTTRVSNIKKALEFGMSQGAMFCYFV